MKAGLSIEGTPCKEPVGRGGGSLEDSTMMMGGRFAVIGALALCAMLAAASEVRAQQDEGPTTEEAPIGLSVDGVVRSSRGGFAFPGGQVMTSPPRLALGGPFVCEPAPGETSSCGIGGDWDFCALSSISFARFNPFVAPSCTIVDRGDGQWSIDIVSSGQFVVRCTASCLRLSVR